MDKIIIYNGKIYYGVVLPEEYEQQL